MIMRRRYINDNDKNIIKMIRDNERVIGRESDMIKKVDNSENVIYR